MSFYIYGWLLIGTLILIVEWFVYKGQSAIDGLPLFISILIYGFCIAAWPLELLGLYLKYKDEREDER